MKLIILFLSAIVFGCSGCASYLLPSASQLQALAADTNSIHIRITSIYGNVEFDRNMGGTSVPITTTFQVQPTK